MTVSWPADSSSRLSNRSQVEFRDETEEASSYSLFGVRVDVVAPNVAARAIFESAAEHRRLRVVLADIWTLLLAQRDFSVWESLSGADLVLPSADDPVVRRLTRRRGISPIWPDHLLHDLLLAMEHSDRTLLVMTPADELQADLALIQRLWPRLHVFGLEMGHPGDSMSERERLAREVSAGQPDILLLGGNSPWQERWLFEQRGILQAGAMVLLPTVQAALAAIAQRGGLKVPAPAWMRRRIALQRAYEATLAPTAAASARALNELLRGPRESISQSRLGHWRLNPTALQRLGLPRPARHERPARKTHPTPAPVRVTEWRGSDESAIRRLTASPLERLTSPRATPVPALPPPSEELDVADQPTIHFTRDELLAHAPEVITGYIVEPSNAASAGTRVATDAVQSPETAADEVIALGPASNAKSTAKRQAAPSVNATTPLPPDANGTTPLPVDGSATTPLPPGEREAPASEPVRRTAPTPLAPTTMLPGRPRRPKQENGAAPEAEHADAANQPPVTAKAHTPKPNAEKSASQAPAPAASIASPAVRLEELSTLKAHLHARRRLLRKRRKLQGQRRRRD